MTAPDANSPVPPPRPPAVIPAAPMSPPGAYPPFPPAPPQGRATPPPPPAPPILTAPLSSPAVPFSVPPAPAGGRSRMALVTLAVAALALLVALGSLAAAWRAVDQAGDAKRFALAGGSGSGAAPDATQPLPASAAPPSDAAPVDEAPTDAPVDPGTPSGTGAPPLDERTVYTVKYDNESLTLKTNNCSDIMYADLDEPRANVGSAGADLMLNSSCSGPSFLKLGVGVEGSTSASPGRTPHDCAEAIRTSPLGESPVPARKGTAICLTTSFEAAQERGDNQRLVLVEISGVADDGAVTIKSRAWNIPR